MSAHAYSASSSGDLSASSSGVSVPMVTYPASYSSDVLDSVASNYLVARGYNEAAALQSAIA